MPGRRKPISTRQKKAEQKLKRAIKRGDVPPPDPKPVTRTTRGPLRTQADRSRATQVDSVRRLQSAFIKLPPKFLEETKSIASTVSLLRPVQNATAVYDVQTEIDEGNLAPLLCPRRPKWRFDMSKKEVEHNEEGLFKKWLDQTDEQLKVWQESDTIGDGTLRASLRSPSYFERNLEVWRQLWRVSEISQILLVLLDSRCPLIHYPPSLDDYLTKHQVIFVLTKVDISGHGCVKTWIDYLHTRYPGTHIVQVESYMEKKNTANQGHSRFEPHIRTELRNKLVEAVRAAHTELLEPPPDVRSNPSRLATWKPPVKRDINWESVKTTTGRNERLEDDHTHENSEQIDEERDELQYLTIGLIGQPNVGKSSLLNALFGEHKVKASRTPGKTKHFQTLFWSREIRLVDCPGLVMPNYIPMELQVLCGILPISRVSAVPACIHFAANLLPLERILNLSHPGELAEPVEDKRTWREGMTPSSGASRPHTWTAMDILVACANSKGWVTAKAARPDIHRAGNYSKLLNFDTCFPVLRLLAEGKIGWAFWPPGTDAEDIAEENGDNNGIWIPRFSALDEKTDRDSSEHEQIDGNEEDEDDADESSEESGSASGHLVKSTTSRFGALEIDDQEWEEDETSDLDT
ncbi:GTPase [Amanita muscaria]